MFYKQILPKTFNSVVYNKWNPMKTYVFELLQKYCVGAIVVLKSWVRWETDKQPWALTLWKELGKRKVSNYILC